MGSVPSFKTSLRIPMMKGVLLFLALITSSAFLIEASVNAATDAEPNDSVEGPGSRPAADYDEVVAIDATNKTFLLKSKQPSYKSGDLITGPSHVGGYCPSPSYIYREAGVKYCCCGNACCWERCTWRNPPFNCLPRGAVWWKNPRLGYFQAVRL